MSTPLQMICEIMKIKPTQLADRLGINVRSLYSWKSVPAAAVPKICNLTGLWPWEICDEYDLEKMKIARAYHELDKRKEEKKE